MRISYQQPKPKQRQRRKVAPAPALLRSTVVDLVVIDASGRRSEERARYGARCAEAETATLRLKAFEEREMPAFARWVDVEFAKEIGTLRQEQGRVSELQALALDVERYAAWTGVSFAVALDRLSRAKAEGTESELWQEALGEDDEQDERDGDGEDSFEEAFSGAFAEDFARDQAAGRSGATHHERPKSAEERTSQSYLKALYRQLVRELHPDTNPDQVDQALWQEVQDAYSWGDVGRLERLRKVVLKSGDGGLNLEAAPIGDIINLRKGVEARLKKLRGSLRTAKGHPAWDFLQVSSAQARLRQLRRQIAAAMADDLMLMQQERRQLEGWIEGWRSPRRGASKARGGAQRKPKRSSGRA